jgi:gluconate 2-dehydrogenase gamma chain
MSGISRRDILRNLTVGAVGGSVLQVIPAEAAALAHQMIHQEKSSAPSGEYSPKYFSAHGYETLVALCELILPRDDRSGGALEAGAPEYIDLLTSENPAMQLNIGGGLMWLDNSCSDRFSQTFLECTPAQRKEMLDLIAYKRNVKSDPSLGQGVQFFAILRHMTCDAFFTSKIGIEDLQYIGNTALAEFPGCPGPKG